MILRQRLFLFLFGLSVFMACSVAAQAQSGTGGTFENPAKQLKGDGLKLLGSGNTILIPMVYSENLIAGVHKASKGGAHAKVTAANAGITPELGTRLADDLLADLVARIRARGRDVLLYADVKDRPELAAVKELAPDKKYQVPMISVNVGYGDMDYLVSAPSGQPIYTRANKVAYDAGAAMRFAKLARAVDAIVVVPTYRFQAPVLYGSTNLSISKDYAEVGISPSMILAFGGFQLLSAKGDWGSYMMDGVETIGLADSVGTLQKTEDAQSTDTSLFDFSTFRSMAKKGYILTVDTDAYYTAAMKAGQDLNTLFASQLP